MKVCVKCKDPFDLSHFGKSSHTKDGLYRLCKGCVKIDNQKRRKLATKGLNWKQSLYDNGEKYCSRCDTVKKFSEFNKSKNSVSGFGSMCVNYKHLKTSPNRGVFLVLTTNFLKTYLVTIYY